MDQPLTRIRSVVEFDAHTFIAGTTEVVTEYALTVFVDGQEFATLVCTPADLSELVVGFIASEGLLEKIEDMRSLEVDEEGGVAFVRMQRKVEINPDHFAKRYITSCCGKGRQSYYFYNDAQTAPVTTIGPLLTPLEVTELVSKMQSQSDLFLETGGVHNAALCDSSHIVASRADIGRHNALDKLFGYMLQQHVSSQDKVMVFSGRISSEVLLKVAKMKVGVLLSKSAPTDMALQMAEELGITAIGFARGDRFKVYTHPERIVM